jgi:hypothetical protein
MYLSLRRDNGSWRTVRSQRISRPNSNIAYPSIAAARDGDRRFVALTYLYASATENPGIAVRFVDSTLTVSPELVVRTGDGPVEFQSIDDFGRWADYTSTVSAPNGQPAVWLFAPYGNRSSTWTNLLARIDVAGPLTSVADPETRITGPSTIDVVLPADRSVTVDLYDMAGVRVRRLYEGYAASGSSVLQPAIDGIPHGAYIVIVRTDDGRVSHSLFLR